MPGFKKHFPRWLDWLSTYFQNLSKIVEVKALKYARMHGYDVICCGHTHEAMHSQCDGIDYFNSGCWVKTTGTYIAFNGPIIEIIQLDSGTKT